MFLLPDLPLVRRYKRTPAITVNVVAGLKSVAEEEEGAGLNWYMVCSKSRVAVASISFATFLANQDCQLSGALTPATLKLGMARLAVWAAIAV